MIDGRENIIYQNNEGKAYFWLKCFEINGIVLENFEKNVIETGFDIYVLVLSLRKAHSHKNDKNRNGKSILNPLDFFKFDPNLNENDEKQNIEHFFIMLFKHFASLFYRSPKISNIVLDLKLAYHFYSSNIGSVEINNKGILAKIYFRIPNMCKFMTNKSRNDIIRKVNRNSYQEKIDDFINRSKLYEVEMLHQQKLARYPVLDFVCCN